MKVAMRKRRPWQRRMVGGALVVCVALIGVVVAQTFPGTAVPGDPFEVYGLLYSGSAPEGNLMGDGWAQGEAFRGVLDENGYPAADPSGGTFRASRMVDPNWGNQGDGSDPTLFSGSNKNHDLIGLGQDPWEWGFGSGGPQKNDITNAYFHTRIDPVTGDRWVFVAAETRSVNGDSHVDFEFNQAGVVLVGGPAGHVVGMGPDGGRTINDFMISIDFEQGGSHPTASVRIWDGSQFVLLSEVPEATFSATNLLDIAHGADGDWKHFAGDGAETNVITGLQFVEGGANLTALNIEVDPCNTDATFSAKTRSSTSWTADLKDFAIASFPLEPVPDMIITAPEAVCAEHSFTANGIDQTGLPNTALNWEVSGCGRLASDPTADTVTIETDAVCNCEMRLSVTAVGGACRHRATASVTIEVGDDSAPELGQRPANATVECDAIPEPPIVSAADDCAEILVTYEELQAQGGCAGESTITRTWTATDGCRNSASHTQILTVIDSTNPRLTGVPDDAAASCDNIPEPPLVSSSDNCSEPLIDYLEEIQPGRCSGEEIILRTWSAMDDCGNEASRTQTLTVTDSAAPMLVGVPSNTRVECDALPEPDAVSAGDNCSDATVTLEETATAGACDGSSTIKREWTAADDCGNQSSQSQLIELVDTTPPVLFGVPADGDVECSAIPEPATVTATDNCSDAKVELQENIVSTVPGKGLITRTWTATDACGNQSSQTQQLRIVDTTDPVLHGVPADLTVECDAIPDPAEVTATDNCAAPRVDFSETIESGECAGQWTIVRTWTTADDCLNSVSATQTIKVVDTTAPQLGNVPEDMTVECDALPAAAEVTATDNCSEVSIRLDEVEEPGDCAGDSTIKRTWTATDECGNSASHVQVIDVRDTTAPQLSQDPADAVVECDGVPRPAVLAASDNCDAEVAVTLLEQENPGSCQGYYSVVRTWSAEDECGNIGSAEQTVTVQDTTAPNISLTPDRTQFICDGRPVMFKASSTDNCSVALLQLDELMSLTANSRDQVIISTLPDGTIQITLTGPALVWGGLTAEDECGNASAAFEFSLGARLGREACSQGYWRNHPERWAESGFTPGMPFIDAFGITDRSSTEIPSGFDPDMTLIEAANMTGGSFDQALLQGTAALLNAAHPGVEYPLTVKQVQTYMQDAFAGRMTFDQARAFFQASQSAEGECGCPLN